MDASKVSASELLPSTGAEGELSGGSEEEGLARRKDELVSSWIQVKWFCASVLLKADSLNMLLRVRRPCEDIFFYRFYQSYHGQCWMQYTRLFHGNSQGPHHSTMNLFTGGADLSTKTETAGTASSPTWAGGDATQCTGELEIAQPLRLLTPHRPLQGALDMLPLAGHTSPVIWA